MDVEAALLSEMAPSQWAQALARLSAISEYLLSGKRGSVEAQRQADRLGLTVRSFYRLVAIVEGLRRGEQHAFKRGRTPWVSSEVDAIISDVKGELGREAADAVVFHEVRRRAERADLALPSYNAVLSRSKGDRVDLRIRLGRKCDFVVDACAMDVAVGAADGTTAAFLTGAYAAGDGTLLGHLVTAGLPTAAELAFLIGSLTERGQPEASVVVIGVPTRTLEMVADVIPEGSLRLHLAGGHGLRPGSASVAALGKHIGRIQLFQRKANPPPCSQAVPLAVARKVVAHILAAAR